MSKKSMEDRFFMEMDDYINGVENLNSLEEEEHHKLLQLGKELANRDFSKTSNKEKVFDRTLENINRYKGEDNMRKSNKIKKPIMKVASIALVCVLGVTTMRTSFAQELVDKVLKSISIGHVTVVENPIDGETVPVSESLEGQIFDKDGNPIEEFVAGKSQKIYTADGEEIHKFISRDGKVKTVTVTEKEKERETQNLVVKNTDELNDYTCFDVILPSYLPEGYGFDRAEFFRDENGVVEDSKYISLFFTNDKTGEFIYMQQRFADEETAYEAGADKVEQIKINGADALLYENNLDWEDNGVIYMLNGRDIARDELIKMAGSFK
ncbi:DUF4367 domain-containing protein [Tissierellaceae bacterium HCP3S3_D8]